MSEEETEQEGTPAAKPKTEKPKSAVDEAKEILEQIQQEKTELAAQRAEFEADKAEHILSGQADAGQAPEQPKEETPQEYAKKVMAGDV